MWNKKSKQILKLHVPETASFYYLQPTYNPRKN